jgi:hypothetical protein
MLKRRLKGFFLIRAGYKCIYIYKRKKQQTSFSYTVLLLLLVSLGDDTDEPTSSLLNKAGQ